MPKASLTTLVSQCNRWLKTAEIEDYAGAVNGLQVENQGAVSRIAAAVDGTLATAKRAIAAGADLLVVHHGLFWTPSHPWTGKRYELLRVLLENNLAVYSSHLPLDLHPKLGNNARLCAALGLRNLQPFFFSHGRFIGFQSGTTLSRSELLDRLREAVGGQPLLIPGGPSTCRRIGVVTGGAGNDLKQAADEGVDTFITGEGPHWPFFLAVTLSICLILLGNQANST